MSPRRRIHAPACLALAFSLALSAVAQPKDAPSQPVAPSQTVAPATPSAAVPAPAPALPVAPPAAPAAPTPAAPPSAQCIERLPSGRERPNVVEKFPERGTAGYVAELVVEVKHRKGESLLPGGVHIEPGSDEAKQLSSAHFALPNAAGSAKASLQTEAAGDETLSRLTLPLIPLPAEPGRRVLELPALPIAMARASGEVFILCTAPHRITVEDPIATEPSPEPRPNPEMRPQLEVWQAAKTALLFGLAALASAALAVWLYKRFRGRVRKGPPPPPPRPPWEVAEEALRDIEASGLIRSGRFDEHFDRVSETIRLYLGDRYGFDGLESTSREALRVLGSVTPSVPDLPSIQSFLREADLVKFARLMPSEDECNEFLRRARQVVERTVPRQTVATEPPATAPSSEEHRR